MKTLTSGAAAIGLAAAGPALACSPSVTPFSEVVDGADFAFFGRADVRMSRVSSPAEEGDGVEAYEGEVRFSGIECYAPPRGQSWCPRSLTIPFQAYADDHNCPPWVLWYDPRRDRYFTLDRDDEGQWQLGGAWRRFGRR